MFDFDDLEEAQASSEKKAAAAAKKAPDLGRKVVYSSPPPTIRDAPTISDVPRGPEPPEIAPPREEASCMWPSRPSLDQRRRRWFQTGKAVAAMIREMLTTEMVAGKGWMDGMRFLVENTPRDHVGRRYSLDDFAGPMLRDHFIQWTSSHSKAEDFRKVILRLEMKVVVATKHLDLAYDWTLRPGAFHESTIRMARQIGATESPPFDGFTHMKRGLLFIGLPLRLYLADSPHLYELIRRMRSLADPNTREVTAASVRKVLDADGFPYATLVWGLIAALQALHAARLTGTRAGTGAQGLCALSATARLTAENRFEVKEVADNCPLIFRGIWVPQRIDEHCAAYTWSFNSFSRSIEGVLWVLDFYAVEVTQNEAVAALAWQESHILLYVARFNAESSMWAFPVQFFNSGEAADVEKELVLPPFVHYEFELLYGSLYEVRSSMSEAMKANALKCLERRWQISLAEHAPQLLDLLDGRGAQAFPGLNRKLRVTVRFIKEIHLCKPLKDILTDARGPPENLLLAFPPKDPEASDNVTSVFGAGRPEVLGLVKPGEMKPLGTFVPGQRVADGYAVVDSERTKVASRLLGDQASTSPELTRDLQ
mmetsp:Transcript_53610/g.124867  ORF Transcript_53610/g.124867 Transcript_53610/m.124867 type:complete len:597 (+) Transcript_53610:49-1839(+)